MKAILFCLILIQSALAHAELDEHQENGLSDTKKLLITPKERNEAIKRDSKAKEVDAKVESLAGSSENKEEIYGIAAQVMEKVTREANGDPAKMQQLLMEAQKNPQAFYDKYFDNEQKGRVRGVATKIEKQKPGIRPAK